ncbi:hypothetical protein BCR39DRAFT_528993 [Naematelia encephala]|uniref:Uncharacterized protein n=1 Tax=Naematelia encephala TaxID=71784 RepID=A0A1Y2B7R4_9TREE|nr:hypothetical protein BCR39DRAFT_528993 [Naematelia encephala]
MSTSAPTTQMILPPAPRGSHPVSFQLWRSDGVLLPIQTSHDHSESLLLGKDSHGNQLVSFGGDPSSESVNQASANETRRRRHFPDGAGGRIVKETAWSIGENGVMWIEPEGTSFSDYDVSIPPFSRLLSATRDFLSSRREAFQFRRTKRLFDIMRYALGLRADFPGPHWSGCRGQDANDNVKEIPSESGEVCVLLTRPVDSIRGFLALARREAEAGWDFEPALKLTRIVAAFMAFIKHHEVITDPHLVAGFSEATLIARGAPEALICAKDFEDTICDGNKWNRASWILWGGVYQGPERGGTESEARWGYIPTREESTTGGFEDDGGWKVDPVDDNGPEPVTEQQAWSAIAPLIAPVQQSQIALLEYIPFARRRISRILELPTERSPTFGTTLWPILTVPAPWTSSEKWRVHHAGNTALEDLDNKVNSPKLDLEKEVPTIPEPNEIVLWVEAQAVNPDLVGMALRGRWAMMGTEDRTASWWCFKPKDFVLPAFWQASDDHSEEGNGESD